MKKTRMTTTEWLHIKKIQNIISEQEQLITESLKWTHNT